MTWQVLGQQEAFVVSERCSSDNGGLVATGAVFQRLLLQYETCS